MYKQTVLLLYLNLSWTEPIDGISIDAYDQSRNNTVIGSNNIMNHCSIPVWQYQWKLVNKFGKITCTRKHAASFVITLVMAKFLSHSQKMNISGICMRSFSNEYIWNPKNESL